MHESLHHWVMNQFEPSELRDITQYGCAAGFSGLIYYSETRALYQRFKRDIWDLLYEQAKSCGMSISSLIASFNGAEDVENDDQFENLLVWFAVEEIARQQVEREYDN